MRLGRSLKFRCEVWPIRQARYRTPRADQRSTLLSRHIVGALIARLSPLEDSKSPRIGAWTARPCGVCVFSCPSFPLGWSLAAGGFTANSFSDPHCEGP